MISLVVALGGNLRSAYAAPGQAGLASQPLEPLAPPTQDQFGYQVSSGVLGIVTNPNDIFWVEEGFGLSREVTFPGGMTNDAISDPVIIGINPSTPGLASVCDPDPPPCPLHPFKFYGIDYVTLFVSMNGVVRFSSTGDSDFQNFPLPTGDLSPAAPTNIIAAFWTDLAVSVNQTTRVYVTFLQDGVPFNTSWNAFAITWENVTRRGVDEPFSFQVVLKDNGDIAVNILTLPVSGAGNLSLGIQDELGSDGLLYHYNGFGGTILADSYAFFERPTLDYRLYMAPAIQGGLTQNGAASFKLQIKNTSEVLEDTDDAYNLTVDLGSNPDGWLVEFYDASGMSKLTSHDGDPIPDTGFLALNQEVTITAKVKAPSWAQPGLSASLSIRAASFQAVGTISRASVLQVAVPSAYLQAYADGTGNSLEMVWRLNRSRTSVGDTFGDSIAVVNWSGGYVYAWSENDPVNGLAYMHFAFLNILGIVIIEDRIPHGLGISDFNPSLAVHKNTGMTALVWVRDTGGGRQARYAILNAAVQTIAVGDTALSDTFAFDIQSPAVAAHSHDGNFTAAWVFLPGVGSQKLQAAVINAGGGEPDPADLTALSDQEIYGLSMEGLPGSSQVLLVYCQTVGGVGAEIRYRKLLGNPPTGSDVLISSDVSADYRVASTAVLSGDQVIVAWLDPTVQSVFGYPVLGVSLRVYNSSMNQIGTTVKLLPPNQLGANYISVIGDKDGKAVLLWLDNTTNRYEYYALVNPNATVETGAMMSRLLGGQISLSYNGQSLAGFSGLYMVNLPTVRR